jgi:hypothetical protein
VPSASAPLGLTLEPRRIVFSQRQIDTNRRNARLATGPSNQPGALDKWGGDPFANAKTNVRTQSRKWDATRQVPAQQYDCL